MLTHLVDKIELQIERVKIIETVEELSGPDERIWFEEPIELGQGAVVRGMDADDIIIEQDGIPTTRNIFDTVIDDDHQQTLEFLQKLSGRIGQFRESKCQKLKT